MRTAPVVVICLAALAGTGCSDRATHASEDTGTSKHAADNTGANKRDAGGANPTSMDQGNSKADLDITQAIRKAVVADDSLSTKAENVKIITLDGVVTLRGPVKSAAEKETIGRLAQAAAGVLRVDNQLEIAP